MMGSLEPDPHLFKSLFRCTATGRRAFSTALASVGMYDVSVGSTAVCRAGVLLGSACRQSLGVEHKQPDINRASPVVH
jgi:hypothetical protein